MCAVWECPVICIAYNWYFIFGKRIRSARLYDHHEGGLSTFMLADSGSESGSHKAGVGGVRGSGGHKSGGGSDGKPTRVRTVLNEKQLHTLRTCYAANPRPDALMKEQLVEMTGLSPRVIRVWFQNKRCKDKKKTIAMKQQMQEKVTSYDIAYIKYSPY